MQANRWQNPQTTHRDGHVVSQGTCPPDLSLARPAAELAAFPLCLRAPVGGMWVFVLLKGLLRSLGMKLRDQTHIIIQPRAAFL